MNDRAMVLYFVLLDDSLDIAPTGATATEDEGRSRSCWTGVNQAPGTT